MTNTTNRLKAIRWHCDAVASNMTLPLRDRETANDCLWLLAQLDAANAERKALRTIIAADLVKFDSEIDDMVGSDILPTTDPERLADIRHMVAEGSRSTTVWQIQAEWLLAQLDAANAAYAELASMLTASEAQTDAANERIAALEAAAHRQCDDLAAQVIELRERAELAEQLLAAEWAEESEAEANALAHEFRTTRTYQ